MPIKTVFTVNNALRRNTIPQKHKEAKNRKNIFIYPQQSCTDKEKIVHSQFNIT